MELNWQYILNGFLWGVMAALGFLLFLFAFTIGHHTIRWYYDYPEKTWHKYMVDERILPWRSDFQL
jgi:hypothetical protein